jgi:hypothetical protein
MMGVPAICEGAESSPRGYDIDLGPDIEGMPFLEGDPRTCPVYGHICPEFIRDLGLTKTELGLRGMIHRVIVIFSLVDSGELGKGSPEYRKLVESYEYLMSSQKKAGNG